MIVGSFRGREIYDSYITNDQLDSTVVFPLEGKPSALVWSNTRLSRAIESVRRGEDTWLDDCRPGFGGAATAALIREKGCEKARIGIVGLGPTSAGEREGIEPHTFWAKLVAAFPDAELEDVSRPFCDLLLVKSAEEIALLRYAALASEAACQAMLDVTRPGVSEEEIYAKIMRAIFRHGCDARFPHMSLHSGRHNIAWGPPRWLARAERPRRVQPGDMVQAEIHTCYGGQEAQAQISVALDPIDQKNRRYEDVARRAYAAGLAALRPGIVFAEFVSAMAAPLVESGCWAKTPFAHTMNFGAGGGTDTNRAQRAGSNEGRIMGDAPTPVRRNDLVLCPGMLLELKPNACLGAHRVNIGGAMLVTGTG